MPMIGIMYTHRSGKGTLFRLLLLAALSSPLFPSEKAIELGKDALWQDVSSWDGAATEAGRWGFLDIVLSGNSYEPDGTTDLLLHFDGPSHPDQLGKYRYASSHPVSGGSPVFGTGSAEFSGSGSARTLATAAGSLFHPGAVWDDFTIELWLCPAALSDGEVALSWEGARKGEAGMRSQAFRCRIEDRRIVWDLDSLFALPGDEFLSRELRGRSLLLPREWHHHLLRYDSRTGLLEYLLDGSLEAVAHVTSTGHEQGAPAVARLGTLPSGGLSLAPRFVGWMDELRISRRFVENPTVSKLRQSSGVVVTRILDLGNPGSRILRIEGDFMKPADTDIAFAMRTADTLEDAYHPAAPQWMPFRTGIPLPEEARGRYLQIRMELFPDGTYNNSPRLSSLRIVFEPNLPPSPPALLTAEAGNGKAILHWKAVSEPAVAGYRIYYGNAPRNYLGVGSAQGDSPIDAGQAEDDPQRRNWKRLEIQGLENGKLYYFAIVAYDSSRTPQISRFSQEVNARPQRVLP
jgi:hypothetical protein